VSSLEFPDCATVGICLQYHADVAESDCHIKYN